MDLKTITYTSRAQLDLTEDDLLEIHETARHLNVLDGITGLLIFDGNRFLQIIEGPEDAIDELVERLRRDRRHSAFELRDERSINERTFSQWSMELIRFGADKEQARAEIALKLPSKSAPVAWEIALRMTASLSGVSPARPPLRKVP